MKRLIFIQLLLFGLSVSVQGFSFQFEGLKRTSESALKTRIHLDDFQGKPFTDRDAARLRNRISALGLFSDIQITIDITNSARISLKEKWTLLPIPMFSTSGKGTQYGLFLMERNFFGLLKELIAGALFGKDGSMVMAAFIDPSFLGTKFTWSIFAKFNREQFTDSDYRGTTLSRYDADKFLFYFNPGYKITPEWTAGLYSTYQSANVDSRNALLPPDDARMLFLGVRTEIKKLKMEDWKKSGVRLRAAIGTGIPLDDHSTRAVKTDLRSAFFLTPGGDSQLNLQIFAGAGTQPDIFKKRLGGKPGFLTLPDKTITARDFASLTLTGEFAVLKFSWATVTLLAFYEAGLYKTEQEKLQTFTGPGCGFRFYLKNVALPAMGLNTAWNLETSDVHVSFSIGMQM